MIKEDIAVIIPFFNNSEHTIKCIKYLLLDSKGYNLNFYLIDDNSNYKHRKNIIFFLEKNLKKEDYSYVKGCGTWWWAKSLNIGLKKAYDDGYQIFLLINNDNIIQKGSLSNLINIYSNNKLDILGSLVIFKNKKIKHYGVEFNKNNGKIIHNYMLSNFNEVIFEKDFIKTDSLGGQGVLINKKVIDTLGYLDNKIFPQYGSDLDYYLRAKKYGINVYITHKSIIIDDEESTGLFKSNKTMSFIDFIRSFYSIKSHMSFSVKKNIYQRYVNKNYILHLIAFYIKYIIRFFLTKVK
jgi:GT2 family glycosyltransferase